MSTRLVGQWVVFTTIIIISLCQVIMSEFTVEKDVYLESLSESEREDLGLITTSFLDYLQEIGRSGALVAVGGSVAPETRGTKRKDIDLIPVVEGITDFKDFKKMVIDLCKKTEFSVEKIIDPVPDEEFYPMPIFRHDGAITLTNNGRSHLEMLPFFPEGKNLENSIDKIQSRGKKYHSELLILQKQVA